MNYQINIDNVISTLDNLLGAYRHIYDNKSLKELTSKFITYKSQDNEYKAFLVEENLHELDNYINWQYALHYNFQIDFVLYFADKIFTNKEFNLREIITALWNVNKQYKLSDINEEIIRYYAKQLKNEDWNLIVRYCQLSQQFLKDFHSNINFNTLIIERQEIISDEIVRKYLNNEDIKYVIDNYKEYPLLTQSLYNKLVLWI